MFSKDYIVGLVDGEGSFTVYVRNPDDQKTVKRRVKAEPRFYLKLIERDKEILEALQKYFGCGNVYSQKDTRANHQNCYRFEVTNRRHLQEIIIPFFKENPPKFPSKRKDFKLFCQMMKLIKAGEHLTLSGIKTLSSLKKMMH